MRTSLAGLLLFPITLAAAHAQCTQWQSGFGDSGINGVVFAATSWDGSGSASPLLVAGGDFDHAGSVPVNHVAAFDGVHWHALGTGVDQPVRSLAGWVNNTGSPRLLAGLQGSYSGTTSGVMSFDGTAWTAMGAPFSVPGSDAATVTCFQVWSAGGGAPARLYAAGAFAQSGGTTLNNIARWDGTAWQPVGGGLDGAVYSMTTWDPDGAGPLLPLLVVGGSFTNAAGELAIAATWDGVSWQTLGSGFTSYSTVESLVSWDSGQGHQLVAAGRFITSDSQNNDVARWDGAAWQPMGAGLYSCGTDQLALWDANQTGRPLLVAAGNPYCNPQRVVSVWDGTNWNSIGAALTGSSSSTFALTAWDPDGGGPAAPSLVVGGSFDHVNNSGLRVNNIAQWDGTAWEPMGPALNSGNVRALAAWDADGSGPQTPEIVAGGAFTGEAPGSQDYIAHWDGAAWRTFGWGTDGPVNAVAAWADTDPSHAWQLVIGGQFQHTGADSTGEVSSPSIAQWTGTAWAALGLGMDGAVNALARWGPDGGGPMTAQIIAGGAFVHAGASSTGIVTVNKVAAWDGSAWRSMAGGLGGGDVLALLTCNLGAGNIVVAGGSFNGAGSHDFIAWWDGTAWRDFGWGFDGPVRALTVWDPDGPGPTPPRLIAAGDFQYAGADSTGGVAVLGIALWDGVAWHALGPGLLGDNGRVYALTTWDVTGINPAAPSLIASSSVSYPAGPPPKGPPAHTVYTVSAWDGTAWRTLGYDQGWDNVNHATNALLACNAGGATSPELVAGGNAGPFIRTLQPGRVPTVTTQPNYYSSVPPGGSVTLSFTTNIPGISYKWQEEVQWNVYHDLSDGQTPGGSTISGTATPVLTITMLTGADAGGYRCVIQDGCPEESVVTQAAQVYVQVHCSADFDHDGDTGTDADIEAFFACLAGNCCRFCGSPDFNWDGDAATDADIESFFRVLAGGAC